MKEDLSEVAISVVWKLKFIILIAIAVTVLFIIVTKDMTKLAVFFILLIMYIYYSIIKV